MKVIETPNKICLELGIFGDRESWSLYDETRVDCPLHGFRTKEDAERAGRKPMKRLNY